MSTKFLPHISRTEYEQLKQENDTAGLYDMLAQPLHEELYRQQTFDFMDNLSEGQQLLLSYDYVASQVGQGGFIQLIQNGYIGLLPDMPGWLQMVGANEMAQIIDDVLKVFVLNKDILNRQTTVQEFALLYEELKEFEEIYSRFEQYNEDTVNKIVGYAEGHITEFAELKGDN